MSCLLVHIRISSPLLQAPGEAEAELAQLNARGIIDGVLTDDVDAVLFGAQTVIRTYVYSTPLLTDELTII